MNRTLPQVPHQPHWFQPVLRALQPVVTTVESAQKSEIEADLQTNDPWLVLENWPLPADAPLRDTSVLLAWEDTDAALYLPQQHHAALLSKMQKPKAELKPVRSNAGREVVTSLSQKGWLPWNRVQVENHGSVATAMAELLTQWVAALQAPADKPQNMGISTDMGRVRAGMKDRPGRGQDPKPVRADDLAKELENKIHGQSQAIVEISNQISSHLARVQPEFPEVIFACGTTGVGKTMTALSIATALNELEGLDEKDSRRWRTLRIDCNNLQTAANVSDLRGASAGYIGYGQSSPLVTDLRMGPRLVLVFDEIEKADPSILVLLMSMMDAGRFTVPHAGKQEDQSHDLDCRESIMFFTSNLAAADMVAEYRADRAPQDLDLALRRRLVLAGIKPEVVGRIGTCVVYLPISDEARISIAMAEVEAAGKAYGLKVCHVCPNILLEILNQPAHSEFGARSDRRATSRLLGQVLAKARQADWRSVNLLSNPTRAEQCA